MSSDSEGETDKENTWSNSKRQCLQYSSDEEKTVETPARFKNCFKLKILTQATLSSSNTKFSLTQSFCELLSVTKHVPTRLGAWPWACTHQTKFKMAFFIKAVGV